jgi:hypothetical protein
MAADQVLTLSGSDAETVTQLTGNVDAHGLSGSLSVTTGQGSLSIATGTGSNTINAAAIGPNNTLTLTGSKAATVSALTGNLAASGDTGALTVTAIGSGPQLITTGSGADTVTAEGGGGDTFTGGGGADAFTVTGHASADAFSYNSVSDSRNNTGAFDTIAGFTDSGDGGSFDDVLNFGNISGLTTIQGSLSVNQKVNAHSIGWLYDAVNNQTLVYANTGSSALSETSSSLMLVDLAENNSHLTANNFKV